MDQGMGELLDLLRREFQSEETSFMLRLRTDIEWDKAAFSRFEKAMRWACEQCEGQEQRDRWMAEGFYYMSWFIPQWTSHPNFPRPEPEQYYKDCIERVGDLADWFFYGQHFYNEPHHWTDL